MALRVEIVLAKGNGWHSVVEWTEWYSLYGNILDFDEIRQFPILQEDIQHSIL